MDSIPTASKPCHGARVLLLSDDIECESRETRFSFRALLQRLGEIIIMSLFKKPRKNYRKRVVAESDEEDESNNGTRNANSTATTENEESIQIEIPIEQSPSIQMLKEKIKKEKGKKERDQKQINLTTTGSGKKLLSFGEDEEEDETFQIKKSSRSQKIAKKLKSESRKEKEMEIKKRIQEKHTDSDDDYDYDDDGYQNRTNKNNEPKGRFGESRNGDENESDSGSDSENSDRPKKPSFKSVLERGEIPDANMIHLARKKRQMARETGFLPLEEPVREENEKSRLVRDDDNDVSDDDDNQRMSFATNVFDKERQAMRDQFLAAEHGSDEDSDQMNEWEQQQIRKGVSVPQVLPEQPSQPLYDQYTSSQTIYPTIYPPSTYLPSMDVQSTTPTLPSLPPSEMPQITVEHVKNALRERLMDISQVNRTHMFEKDKVDNDLATNLEDISLYESKVSSLEEQYKFFQEMRGYVRDLVECLNEKLPRINNLEEKIIFMLKQRTQRLCERRQQDIKDQSAEYNPNKVAQPVAPDSPRQRRAAEREARRARRRRAREGQDVNNHKEGLSSDDEENKSEISKFHQERVQIHNECCGLFDDVIEDFYKIKRVKNRFQQWKFQYGDSYKEAYIGLCLPKLFTPLIRLQLVEWNPLETSSTGLEKLPWFQSLIFYGFRENENTDMTEDDDDLKLLPNILDKVLLPRLILYVEGVWDPVSASQTAQLSNLVRKLIADFPISMESKNLQALVKAVVERMKKTLNDDVFMPLYPKTVTANRGSPASVFFHRQLWSCIKIFGNVLSWSEVLNDGLLKEVAIDGLLNRYILLGLMNSPMNQDGIQKCEKIISYLPKHWFGNLEGDSTFPPLENFCRFLVQSVKTVEQATPAVEFKKRETRDTVKQITKLLVNLHAMDHAIQLANQFSLKI
ncbi:PAX3- and PAX7-binding protein 1-like [Tubulanus polymorphus]|uniref:PAX3- and PAX7-binding protein 1-like n=1 Tax=Tubulanus polymorphus TaxID=672921 RepID=UPI003DA29D32